MAGEAVDNPALMPVTLLTGFLGSGKTTLLNHLVRQPELADTLVIINEFGAISLDHLLVTHTNEDMIVQMDSGCICCTIRGDLKKTLQEITWRFAREGKRQFNRVVIETTGLADPTPILHTLMRDEIIITRYRLAGVVTTVDSVNGMQTLDTHPEAVKQVAVADRLLLTKSDLASEEDIVGLQERLARINPGAQQVSICNGQTKAATLFSLDNPFSTSRKTAEVLQWLNSEAFDAETKTVPGKPAFTPIAAATSVRAGHKRNNHPVPAHNENRHNDHIRAFCFTFDQPINPYLFDDWIGLLLGIKGPDILRVKGIVNLLDRTGPTVIHGVQHIFHPPVELPAWPSDDHRTRIVFITKDIDRSIIDNTFSAFMEVHDKLREAEKQL